MKRGLFFVLFIVIVLFISSLVLGEETLVNDGINLTDDASLDSVKDKSNAILENPVNIPANLQPFVRYILGINESTIGLSELVFQIALFLFILIIIVNLIIFIPFFDKGWKSYLGSLLITMLIANSGAMNEMTNYYANNSFFDFDKWGILKLAFTIIIIAVFAFGVSYLIRMVKNKGEEVSAEQAGIEVGMSSKIWRNFLNILAGK